MIVVIQCAATKQPDAGCLVSASGKPVVFVARPESAPTDDTRLYARPDDFSHDRKTWRESLLEYNERSNDNPLGLYPAYRLYKNCIYGRLVEVFGVRNVYILSAGWGLIKASSLTPYYDITYSPSAEGYKRRRKGDHYRDFCMLPKQPDDEIVFLGGKDYLPLFCALTSSVKAKRTIFYNSSQPPKAGGCTLKLFQTSTRTNWHYECAEALLSGKIA
jgi:hypothetical protein